MPIPKDDLKRSALANLHALAGIPDEAAAMDPSGFLGQAKAAAAAIVSGNPPPAVENPRLANLLSTLDQK